MGKYSQEVKRKSQEGTKRLEQSKKLGENVIREAGKKASMLDALSSEVDEEILNIRQLVREKVKEEGQRVMDTQVKSELEAGKRILQESSNIAQDQISKNRTVIETLRNIENNGDLGSHSAREGIKVTESSTRGFEQDKNMNERAGAEASRDYQSRLSALMSI